MTTRASGGDPSGDGGPSPSPEQAAGYIASMLAELLKLAQDGNLPFLAHLLGMTLVEAHAIAKRGLPK